MQSHPADQSPGPTVPRALASVLAGLVAACASAVGGVLVQSLALVVFAPVLGGLVTGGISRAGRAVGTVLGLIVGAILTTGVVGTFGYGLATSSPMIVTAAPAVVLVALNLVVVGGLVTLFAGLGGLLGAILRTRLQ